jgi:DNA-directed RNA polymerase subunit E'/Rpb7
MDNIYFNCVLTKKIVVEAKYLNEYIDEYINNYLKKKVEGKCIDEGHVQENSVKIIKKSIGMLLGSRFTGDVTYEIFYTASVCNPVIGNIIDCKVKFINKLGILGHNGPITIIVGKQFQTDEETMSKIKENDIIKVEVIAKKFSLNDNQIKLVAKLWNKDSKNIITASDLTPIINDNEYFENEQLIDDQNYNMDENYEMSEDESDVDDDNSEEEYEDKIEIKNPEELEAGDIDIDEYDEDEEEEDDEEDDESINEY